MEIGGRVLVDGGAMNNVPANVVRDMGADTVIAINVGFMGDVREVNYSLIGLMGQTVDVMMQANTRVAMRSADIVINPPLKGFGSLDWRRFDALAADGYQATEAMRDKLLPLALDEAEWAAYVNQRRTRRHSQLPVPAFLSVVGATPSDQLRMEQALRPRIGQPIDLDALEKQLEAFGGLDRYETVDWHLIEQDGRIGLQVRARPKTYAPPFLMLGVSLENTTTSAFAFTVAGRYLTFDVAGSGSELRIDGAVGAEPRVAADLYRPLGATALFVDGFAGVERQTLNFIRDDAIVAEYDQTTALIGAGAGVNVGRDDDVRASLTMSHLSASIAIGDPGLPELSGLETRFRAAWRHDGQDSVVVPSSGVHAVAEIVHVFKSPALPATFPTTRSNEGLTQAQILSSTFWSLRQRDRVFVVAGGGTSFGNQPLPTAQFPLGGPLRLGAHDIGEFRGNNYALLTSGYLRGIGRLPDFIGGPVYVGGWLENGSAFDDLDSARWRTNATIAAVLDTLIGPAILGGSFGFDGHWRYYVGIGRIF
jgi:NTE family protein